MVLLPSKSSMTGSNSSINSISKNSGNSSGSSKRSKLIVKAKIIVVVREGESGFAF